MLDDEAEAQAPLMHLRHLRKPLQAQLGARCVGTFERLALPGHLVLLPNLELLTETRHQGLWGKCMGLERAPP